MKPTPDTNQTGTPENRATLVVVGLGYVGLPLAVAFAKHRGVVGFDIKAERISELKELKDRTGELKEVALSEVLVEKQSLELTNSENRIAGYSAYIIAVPTPVDASNVPDLTCLRDACETVGKALAKGSLVVFESTVYPKCTEEFCIPLLEKFSGRKAGQDFYVAYSPERVNPGDEQHTLKNTTKLVAANDPMTLNKAVDLYKQVCDDVFEVHSIKVAEAAKAIENAQRDLNIAFVNELAMMFSKMGIDTQQVLRAAGTKWNFLGFKPGLVGGHCIGVDPYYLAHAAVAHGYYPQVILAGRCVNESVAAHIALRLFKKMWRKVQFDEFFRVLVLGCTFKENCPDVRNSKVKDICRELKELGCEVVVCDPLANTDFKLEDIYKLQWDGIVLAVPHAQFQYIDWIQLKQGPEVRTGKKSEAVIFDVKGMLHPALAELRL
jgi:UDP-N-acetyl-D-galactosamine dehydrogenase